MILTEYRKMKQQIFNSSICGTDNEFILSDISNEELAKRRIDIYSYLL